MRIVDQITRLFPRMFIDVTHSTRSYIDNLQLADPAFNLPAQIDVLLDAAVFVDIARGSVIFGPIGHLFAISSVLGHLLLGRVAPMPIFHFMVLYSKN